MPDFLADALTWPHNYPALLAVETAYKMGVRPLTFMLDDAQPNEKWTVYDKKLLMAWTILDKETCTECGQPLWICRSSDSNLGFSVRKGLCYAKKAMHDWRESAEGKRAKEWETPYTVPSRYDETTPLPTRRAWMEELAEE